MAKFKGNRCIPTAEGKWDKTKEYLGLSVVLDEKTGDSYTSKKVVPAGTELTNKDYWALSGQYNAQMALIKLQLEAMQNIPVGGTTADAALENIRIGADGTEYATPGDAVRGQIGALSEEIVQLSDELLNKSANRFDKSKVLGGYISNIGTILTKYNRVKVEENIGCVVRFKYDSIFDGQAGIIRKSDDSIIKISDIATLSDDKTYKNFTIPNSAKEVYLNIADVNTYMYTVDCEYPNEYEEFKNYIRSDGIVVTTENCDFVYNYNFYKKDNLINGWILSNGTISTSATAKRIILNVKENDLIRYTNQPVIDTQSGGAFSKSGTFVECLSKTAKNKGEYKEYIVPSGVRIVYINVTNEYEDNCIITINDEYNPTVGKEQKSENVIPCKESVKLLSKILPLSDKVDFSKLFKKSCHIGDSLTRGDYGDGKGEHDYNYPCAFGRLTGIETANLGISGQTAKSWYTNKDNWADGRQDFSKYDLFFILLGQNGGLSGNLDSSDDSNAGYYCKIIEDIKLASPLGFIFLLTIPHNGSDSVNNAKNEIIKQISAKYNLPILDLRESSLLTIGNMPIYQPYDKVLHYGKVGALTLASEVKRLMNESIIQDLSRYNVIDS